MSLSTPWFIEKTLNNSVSLGFQVTGYLHQEKSPFQEISVIQTEGVGKMLLLDGRAMLSEADEFIYHEVLSHVPVMVQEKTERVLIIGGGDGGVAREFSKYEEVLHIDLVEIDERVVRVVQNHFPKLATAFDSSKVHLHFEDGFEFLKNNQTKYDVIIVDCTDPDGPAEKLFEREFFSMAKLALNENGILMSQSESPFFDNFGIKKIYSELKSVFSHVESLCAPMLVYPGGLWTFSFASNGIQGQNLNKAKILKYKNLHTNLEWYNTNWHLGAFALSNLHKKSLGLQ